MTLAPTVRAMLEQLAEALEDTPFDPATATTTFRIGLVDVMEYLLAPKFARLIREEAPQIRFAIQSYDSASYQTQLGNATLDIVIGLADPTAQNIHSSKLAALSPVGLVRKNHPLTQGAPSVREFNQTPRLTTDLRASRPQQAADATVKSAVDDPIYTTAHFFSVPLLLANSDLLLITSQVVADLLCAQYPLVAVPLPSRHPPLEPHIFWHQRTDNDPAQKWMRAKIIAAVHDLASAAS